MNSGLLQAPTHPRGPTLWWACAVRAEKSPCHRPHQPAHSIASGLQVALPRQHMSLMEHFLLTVPGKEGREGPATLLRDL